MRLVHLLVELIKPLGRQISVMMGSSNGYERSSKELSWIELQAVAAVRSPSRSRDTLA